MRLAAAALLLMTPLAAFAQQSPDRPPGDGTATDAPGASTPAPVPSVPPQTAQTPGMSAPPEQIIPADPGALRNDAGPRDATPYSAAPVPEEGRSTPELGR